MRFVALVASVLVLLPAQAQERSLSFEGGRTLRYRLLEPSEESAKPVALRLLQHLADGAIEEAAQLSNAPERRREVLTRYRESVGEADFRRVFADYLSRRVIAEVAIGERRLLIWSLDSNGRQLAGQYFVRVAGSFLLDEVPNEDRSKLQRVLAAYRAGRIKP